MTPDDWGEAEELMERFYNGDDEESHAAYTRLTVLLLPYLTFRILTKHRMGDESGDLAWEILVKIWVTKVEGGARYDLGRTLRPWLNNVARNYIIDRARHDSALDEVELPSDDLIPERDEEDEVEIVSSDSLVKFGKQHRDCRDKLDAEHADVYERHCRREAEGGSVEAMIAVPLGLTYGEANGRLHKARKQVRACLKHHGFELVPIGSPKPPTATVVCRFRTRTTGDREMLLYTPPSPPK